MSRRFNPSRGIAIIQTHLQDGVLTSEIGFNPSRGIAIIQTPPLAVTTVDDAVSIPHAG